MFSRIEYSKPSPLFAETVPYKQNKHTIVVAGIAAPQPFIDHVEKTRTNVQALVYPDHHNFSKEDISRITSTFEGYSAPVNIITTEKDAKRLMSANLPDEVKKYFYFVPIKAALFDNADSVLINNISRYVKENADNSGVYQDESSK